MNDDFPILAAIAATPAHPYRVLDHLNALGIKATRSTLYRRVDVLTAAGLLPGEKVPPSPMERDPNVPAPLAFRRTSLMRRRRPNSIPVRK